MITATPLTAPSPSAIAVIAITGENAAAALAPLVPTKQLSTLLVGNFTRADLIDPHTHSPLDDALIVRTGDDTYELHVHGGAAVMQALLNALEIVGIVTQKTVVLDTPAAESLDLTREITVALPLAQTLTAARLLAAQGQEGLAAWAIRALEWLDTHDANDLWRLQSAAQWLLLRSASLRRLLHPARVAIVGPPNAGKSTLANALLGRPIAITSDIAGTTRDWVDAATVFISGQVEVPVLLIDTAGVRDTDDPLERESIRRTHQQSQRADIVLLLFDSSRPPSAEESAILHTYSPRNLIVIANKIDQGDSGLAPLRTLAPRLLNVSAKTRAGIEEIAARTLAILDLQEVQPEEPFLFTARQRRLIEAVCCCPTPRRTTELVRKLLWGQ